MGYKLRDKRQRNREMFEFWKTGQELTYDEVGEKFNVTGSRAFAIIKSMLKKEEKAKVG